jgi:hypothetical protein
MITTMTASPPIKYVIIYLQLMSTPALYAHVHVFHDDHDPCVQVPVT